VRTAAREVVQPIAYLASSQAASITGADFLIDGGLVKDGPVETA
jgi:NAD(P)-dependent dehydrogenase (short-subunit alcohol dehydrogenase family)